MKQLNSSLPSSSEKFNPIDRTNGNKCICINGPILKNLSYNMGICYSPSRRFALLAYDFDDKGEEMTEVIIVDLVARIIVYTIPVKFNLQYWYWLNESEFAIVSNQMRKGILTQYTYFGDFKDPFVDIQLTNCSVTNLQPNTIIYPFTSAIVASQLTIHGHDFLFVNPLGMYFMLIPFDPNAYGPLLPPLKIHIPETISNVVNGSYSSSRVFSHRNKLYFYIWNSSRSHCLLDRFLCLEITNFDLEKQTASLEQLDPENPPMFIPKQLNDGRYGVRDGDVFGGNRIRYIQNGPIIMFMSQKRNDNKTYEMAWVLNMDEETIYERKIPGASFGQPTLYTDMLLYCEITDNKKMVFKFNGMLNGLPKLKDLCTIALMSTKRVNPMFQKKYEKLSRF